jgi:hypothetical protein
MIHRMFKEVNTENGKLGEVIDYNNDPVGKRPYQKPEKQAESQIRN